jgi:DNA replication protein DnaC
MSTDSLPTCPNCRGTGYRHIEGKEGVVKCECNNDNRSDRLIHAAGIPKKYTDCRLDNYVTSDKNPYLQMAFIKASGYVDQYFTQSTPKGLLFQGTPGLGKTHLAVAIIRRLMELKPITCYFCNFAGELQRIKDSMGSSRSINLPRLVYDAEILILDDFGVQRWSSWVQDQMSNVISNRYDNGRATIITTNLSDKPAEDRTATRMAAMKKLGVMDHDGNIDTFAMSRLEQVGIRFNVPHDEPETLEEQLGTRLRSRLYEMCDVVSMYGEDYRRVKAQKDRDFLRR